MVKQATPLWFLVYCLAIATLTILLPVTREKNTLEVVTMVTSKPTLLNSSVQPNILEKRITFPLTIGDSPYIINNSRICNGVKQIVFLVLVHTATNHSVRRESIRETWANYSMYRKYKMRIVFLVGLPENGSLQEKLEEESRIHGDLVQGNFLDTYRNLTHKGVMGLRWVTEFCRQAKFIVKTDDDVFVNTLLLIRYVLVKYWNSSRMIIGSRVINPKVRRYGKWSVDKSDFRGLERYPFPYSKGEFVVLTSDIIQPLYKAAKVTPFFWIDDIYLFGQLPNAVGRINHVRLDSVNNDEAVAVACYSSKKCRLIAGYAYSDGVMRKMWSWAMTQYKVLTGKYLNRK